MAKVRIQARNADVEEPSEHHEQLPLPGTHRHAKNKHVSAVAILQRVWKREGFLGWYQVCFLNAHSLLSAR
jgi:hypothetical protein